jgi:nicotinamide mononucleotide (NMN) deamidase PncC
MIIMVGSISIMSLSGYVGPIHLMAGEKYGQVWLQWHRHRYKKPSRRK